MKRDQFLKRMQQRYSKYEERPSQTDSDIDLEADNWKPPVNVAPGETIIDISGHLVRVSTASPSSFLGMVAPPFSQRDANTLAQALHIPPPAHIGYNIYVSIAVLTPGIAHIWLRDRNKRNRNPQEKTLEEYVATMKGRHWWLTHQGAAFTGDGLMLDTQHRCEAVIETGEAIHIMVTLNVSIEAAEALDQGLKRRMRDFAAISGVGEVTAAEEAIIRRLIEGVEERKVPPTPGDKLRFKKLWAKQLEWLMGTFGGQRRPQITVAPVKAGVFRAYVATSKTEELKRFVKCLLDERHSCEREKIPVALATWLRSPNRNKLSDGQLMQATEKAIIEFLDHKESDPVRSEFKADRTVRDHFPLPKEPETKLGNT